MLDERTSHALHATAGDILVVDDHSSNLIAIEAALGSFEGKIVRASSGPQALRSLLEHDYAVILLDVKMPSMDGFEAVRLIRARKHSSHTPIIFITARACDDQEVLAAYKLGAVDFLAKPIVPEVLRAKVGVFVELQRRTAEIAHQAELIREHERRERERAFAQERACWEAEALRRRMDHLAEADQHNDRFLAVLTHELRNPLTPLVTGLELLQQQLEGNGAVDPRVLKTRAAMQRQVQHLTRLLDDLLDISRISCGKIELRKGAVVVAEVIEQAVTTSRPLLDARQHRLTLDVPPEPLMVHGDALRLVQVVANLLNNAARYTEPGGHIQVRAVHLDDRVQMHVQDNGRGIAPEFLSQVFDTFAQENPWRGHGLGLGLTVVRRIIALHDGSVSVSSPGPGQGADFVVTLPLRQGGSQPLRAPQADEPGSKSLGATPGRSVVLVEDSDDIRELMTDLLSSWGHHVATAGDGAAGVELVLRSKPQVAFIDIGLPVLDGYEVASRIRASTDDKRLRLVAMTGFGQSSDKRRAQEAGFDMHLVKPASVEALRKALVFEDD